MASSTVQELPLAEVTCLLGNTRAIGHIGDPIRVAPGVAHVGTAVVGRVLNVGAYARYGLEDRSGRFYIPFAKDDLVVGMLADRLSGTELYGRVPPGGISVPTREPVELLGCTGVIGQCEAVPNHEGDPTRLELLGIVVTDEGEPRVATARPSQRLEVSCPMILVGGTASEVGKTTFASRLVRYLARVKKLRVASAKLAGTGALQDILQMRDAGACVVADFVEFGLVTTYGVAADVLTGVARSVLNKLAAASPDIIVAELGGDIFGAGVEDLLADRQLQAATSAFVLVPSDVLAAYGTVSILRQWSYRPPVHLGLPIRNPVASRARAKQLLDLPMYDAARDDDLASLLERVHGRNGAR